MSAPAAEQNDAELRAGVFLIDKPVGWTSFTVVRQVRRLLNIKKVGHAGTLDPFASGLLIICAGRPATRLVDRFMVGRKTYSALLQLGVETETQDPEGSVCRTAPVPELSRADIEICLQRFVGPQLQAPPPYSAAKYKGKPLYHYARKGIEVKKEPKPIEIYGLAFGGYDPQLHQLRLEVACSRGTYVRVLAEDIGRELGCGAHLKELRRLGSGSFSVADSLPGEKLEQEDALQKLVDARISVDRALIILAGAEENKEINRPEK